MLILKKKLICFFSATAALKTYEREETAARKALADLKRALMKAEVL